MLSLYPLKCAAGEHVRCGTDQEGARAEAAPYRNCRLVRCSNALGKLRISRSEIKLKTGCSIGLVHCARSANDWIQDKQHENRAGSKALHRPRIDATLYWQQQRALQFVDVRRLVAAYGGRGIAACSRRRRQIIRRTVPTLSVKSIRGADDGLDGRSLKHSIHQ